MRWVAAFASPTRSRADALNALSALPSYLPLPDSYLRTADIDEPIGRAFLLGGRAAEAIPFLRRAAHCCYRLAYSLDALWATLELGEALDATGQRAEACAQFRDVLARVGRSREHSRSAQVAEQYARELRCEPSVASSRSP
jgi:serine/threonine-protein kinase